VLSPPNITHVFLEWGVGGNKEANLKVGAEGGGVNALEGWGVNTVKTLKFEKGGGCIYPPPASMVVPPLALYAFLNIVFMTVSQETD